MRDASSVPGLGAPALSGAASSAFDSVVPEVDALGLTAPNDS